MKLLLLDDLDEKALLAEIDRIGADRRSFRYFSAKSGTLLLSVNNLDVRAANALKQEMLSRGGDIIVHKRTIECGIPRTDALLMGTPGQFSRLVDKLAEMPYWGLDQLKKDLEVSLRNARRRAWNLLLPRGRNFTVGEGTKVMGIVNVTEDSFYGDSRRRGRDEAVKAALVQLDQGADLVDIGAESTRPGALPLPVGEEISRVVPVIAEIRSKRPEAVLSVDTRKAQVARAAVDAGVDIVNDVSGLRFDPDMPETLASLRVPVILMHSRKTPSDMQECPSYREVVREVWEELDEALEKACRAGIAREAVVLDPGLGFAKNASHNLSLLRHLAAFKTLGRPLLVGHSRKSTIGQVLSIPDPAERLEGTLAVTALAAWQGISFVRVHDVRENLRVVRMVRAIRGAS